MFVTVLIMIIRELQPVTLMVYIGPEKVWTPGHKAICGSLGHNVMVYAEPQAYSMWFCIGRRKYYLYSCADENYYRFYYNGFGFQSALYNY